MPTTTPDEPDRTRRPLGRGPSVVPQPSPPSSPPPEERPPEPVRDPDPAPDAGPEPGPVAAQEARRPVVPAPSVPAEPQVPLPAEPAPAPPAVPAQQAAEPPAPAAEAPQTVAGPPSTAVEVPEPREPDPEDSRPAAEGEEDAEDGRGGNRFTVRLANFEGPFDLLLQLISKHKLDVTEVALSKVTNEFMAHLHAMGPDWDLDQTTEFLVVAATLLDLKAARLLPSAEVEDEADLALLEARDLLFARLLQYRAYKQIAAIFAERLEQEALRHPRTVGLEPQHAELLPEVVLSIGPERFAALAVKAMQPKPKPQVYVDHIHAPLVSVREQAERVIELLRERGAASFGELTADAPDTLTVVARFLALLELYREKAVALDQEEALGSLQVRWTGAAEDGGAPLVTDEFDQEAPAEPAGKAAPGSKAGSGTRTGEASASAASVPGPRPVPAPAGGAATTEPGPAGKGEQG